MPDVWPMLADFTPDQLHEELAWCNAISTPMAGRNPLLSKRAAYRAAVVRELARRETK